MMKDDDFKLLRGFVTDRQTNGRTFVNVESLSRLKTLFCCICQNIESQSSENEQKQSDYAGKNQQYYETS